MSTDFFYSVRMRASAGTKHLSGAEHLVSCNDVVKTVYKLAERAMTKGTSPDKIIITVESLQSFKKIRHIHALDVLAFGGMDITACRAAATQALLSANISKTALDAAFGFLDHGAAPSGGNMRGAIIMDAETGARLEPDPERGVRVSRVDWSENIISELEQKLASLGLIHFRTREALALATKVAHAQNILAELCWSDDHDYVAGYVSSRRMGYLRLPVMKHEGIPLGGRVFFINGKASDISSLIHFLEKEPVIITDLGIFHKINRLSDLNIDHV